LLIDSVESMMMHGLATFASLHFRLVSDSQTICSTAVIFFVVSVYSFTRIMECYHYY